ncbi:hypothetical protein DXG03_005244 [Asterophora parasitica]|uniref:Peptidase M20 dimerisation domain-containing protein n=1 Tax=Asterophora parasitica TaxID=117018 RepID=A0A9P7K8R8_9AGAR|nr:hypothetical protein DXG03_005244 [Asterophora parasitica]
MSRSNAQVSCFTSLNFRKLFHRRTSSKAESQTSRITVVRDQVAKHNHILCGAGEEWIFEPDGLPSYSAVSHHHDEKTSPLDANVVATIEDKLDELDATLRELSKKLHDNPELAFNETYAAKILTDFMKEHGFRVELGYGGMGTGWRAEYTVGKGGRVLGVNSEMDALPGIGHACGHNLIAIVGLGIAVAVKEALVAHNVPGKIVILGTPAEEGGGGKIILLKKNAYKEMDACLMAHPAGGALNSSSNGVTGAAQAMFVEFHGTTAHAAAAPWEGRNALDAAVVAYSSISALRQQIKPDHRIHGIIEGSNWTANTIPDYAKLTYIVRAPNKAELEQLAKRVVSCFHGAASSSGCVVRVEMIPPYLDLRQNAGLAREFSSNIISRYGMSVNETNSAASTDFGNVSYELPSLHPLFAIPTQPNGGNHTAKFTESASTPEAHVATLNVTKGLALTGFRVISDDKFFKEAVSFEVFYVIQNQNMRFFNLTSARKLRKLRVRTYELILSHPSRLRVPWGQLTHLALETRLSLLSWHHVIRATPLLQKCHVYFIGFNPEPNEDVPVNHENDIAALRTLTPRTVTLHHLRELVTTFTGPFSSAIFSDVSCPRLQTLKVANSLVGCGFQSDDLPLDFFKKTAPSLTSLMLSHTEMSADQLLRVLRHAPRITELRIDCEGDHDKLLKALTISRDAEILLPRLISFHMSAVSYFRLDEEGIPPTFSAHVFAEAIRSRWYYAKIEGRPFQAGLFIDDRLTRQRKLRNVEASLSGCKAEGLDLTTGTVVNLKNVKRNTVDPRGDYPWGFRFTDWLEWRTEY